MRAVAYCRVSTDHESQINSFEAQQGHYLRLFKDKEYIVPTVGMVYKKDKTITYLDNGIYADEGLSGAKSFKYREAFKQMIRDAKLGKFDKIYIKNITRFARNVEEGSQVIKDLREHNVEVYFEDGGLSTKNPTSNLVINMLLSTAEEESRLKSSAVQWGIREQQLKGKWHSTLPFGYNKEDGYLVVNEEESKVVKKIFDIYLNKGDGTQKIAKYLNANNIKTKKGKQWSNKQICDIIQNGLYAGKQTTHISIVDPTARFITKEVDKDKHIIHYFDHLKIIDDEMFKNTQIEYKRRSEAWKFNNRQHRHSNEHLLSNLLICGNCGNVLRRKKRKAYKRMDGTERDLGYEWVCTMNDRYGNDRCKYRNQVVEEEIIMYIKEDTWKFKNSKNYIDDLHYLYVKLYYNKENSEKEKREIEKSIEQVENKVELNFELLGEGIIGKEEYYRRNEKLQEELRNYRTRHVDLLNIEKEIERVNYEYKQYLKLLDSVDIENLNNAILKRLIDKVEVITVDSDSGTTKKDIEIMLERGGHKLSKEIIEEKKTNIYWNFLTKNNHQIWADFQLYMTEKDHSDKVPPEQSYKHFRA